MTIWYGTGDDMLPLICESEIAELFDRCNESKIVRFGVTIESKNNESANVRGDEENDEPVHAPFFAWPNQAYAGEYEDDEPVQYEEDEEEKKPNFTIFELGVAAEIARRVPLGTLDVDNSYDEQNVPGDDEEIIANSVVPTHIHDRKCPQIQGKSTFVDGKTFKVALRQLAIREEWSFNTQYSDKERFRATCSDEDCPWRIHASKLKGCNTFMVKKLPFAHTCGSANKSDKKKGKARMATWTYEAEKHESFIAMIEAASPEAISYLRKHHDRVWTRSKFSPISKVEYVSNNLAEVFNNWIREKKQLAIVELVDKYREMLMQMRGKRKKVADGLQGTILPSVVKELNQKSKGLRYGEAKVKQHCGNHYYPSMHANEASFSTFGCNFKPNDKEQPDLTISARSLLPSDHGGASSRPIPATALPHLNPSSHLTPPPDRHLPTPDHDPVATSTDAGPDEETCTATAGKAPSAARALRPARASRPPPRAPSVSCAPSVSPVRPAQLCPTLRCCSLMDKFIAEIDVQSYLTNVDGKRVYQRGKTWGFEVGRDLSVAQIKAAVEEKFQWSTDQRMTIWYGTGDDMLPLICESEIAELFDRCNESKIVRFGVTIESKNNESANVRGDEENDEPVHAPFFAWPNQAYAGEYEDDEPVQYEEDEEEKKPNFTIFELGVAAEIARRVPLGTLDVDNSYDEQNVPGDDEEIIANSVVPTHIHDRKCPQIQGKSTFVDGKTFKVALRQLAIREEWSFNTQYSDKERFRATCSDEDCPWRIHASKLKGCNTFMVKKLPFAHTCGSANKSDKKKGKARMATWTYEAEKHESFIAMIEAASPEAISYLRKHHDRVWTRSKFSPISKVEYVSNNLAEVFNNWIREKKQLAIVELVDKYREMLMQMRGKRKKVADGLQGTILPSVVKELNQKSKGLRYGEAKVKQHCGNHYYPSMHANEASFSTFGCNFKPNDKVNGSSHGNSFITS
ncbi:hypothetical protein ACQ4PT_027024 [Festuca glaucescens]